MYTGIPDHVLQFSDYVNLCERATEKLSSELRTQDFELVSSIINLGSDSARVEYKFGHDLLKLVDEWLEVQKREQDLYQLIDLDDGFFYGLSREIEVQKKVQENCELISLIKNDNNILSAAILNNIEGFCIFIQLADFSHDSRINTRKQFSDGIKLISEDYVPLYVFSKDDQFPEEDFSFVWKRE